MGRRFVFTNLNTRLIANQRVLDNTWRNKNRHETKLPAVSQYEGKNDGRHHFFENTEIAFTLPG